MHRWVADSAMIWHETVSGIKYKDAPIKATRPNGE